MRQSNDSDWNKFEKAVQYLRGNGESLYFRDVIKASTGKKLLPFNKNSLVVMDSVESWITNNLSLLSNKVYKNYKGRANELGNEVEKILRIGLNEIKNLKCDKPILSSGKKQSSGYPDILIESGNVKIYADIKTFQTKTIDSKLRSFFYEPTNKSKIHFDAPHCIIGFETRSLGGENKSPFKIINFKIIDLYKLKVKLKAEFNAGNSIIYKLSKPS
ncbi:MAG: hypothetical protein NTU46_11835 [Burkholderiales bacterium]|nr:hypothetical protein [Burkholderiales bacterium]